MTVAEAPARTELVKRASELVPLLQANATWTEDNRRLHEQSIEALADAGIFKMRRPVRYGGYESDARTMVDVATELGRGDGSTSWVASVLWITTWMIGLFSDELQDEVFSTPDARVCGTLSPSAMATPGDGGVTVNGQWGFISGALHSHWQLVVAIQATPDGQPMPIMAAVPMSDLQIVDDWYVSGLRGTGSVSTVAQNVFIPQHRILPLPAMLHEQYASQRNAGSHVYRVPLLPTASASSVGAVIGMAHAAKDAFFARLPERKITYTTYPNAAEAPITHLRSADAVLNVDAAQFHARRVADFVDATDPAEWTVEDRARARADLGRACQLAQDAVDTFKRASGGSSIYQNVPIQRIERDIAAVTQHALMHPDTNTELYGRLLCGLEPNTFYI